MWNVPANLPPFDGERADLIGMFHGHAQMLWAWSWIAPDHPRTGNLKMWKEAIASFQDDPGYLLDLGKMHVRELEQRAAKTKGGRPPATAAEKLKESSIHRCAKMALVIRDVLSNWYPRQSEDDIEDCANEIVVALWKKSVRAMALAEAAERGKVTTGAEGWNLTTDKLEHYFKRPPDDPRRLV